MKIKIIKKKKLKKKKGKENCEDIPFFSEAWACQL